MLLNIIQTDDETIKKLQLENTSDSSLFDEAKSSLRMKIIICSTMLRMLRTLREEQELIIKLKKLKSVLVFFLDSLLLLDNNNKH